MTSTDADFDTWLDTLSVAVLDKDSGEELGPLEMTETPGTISASPWTASMLSPEKSETRWAPADRPVMPLTPSISSACARMRVLPLSNIFALAAWSKCRWDRTRMSMSSGVSSSSARAVSRYPGPVTSSCTGKNSSKPVGTQRVSQSRGTPVSHRIRPSGVSTRMACVGHSPQAAGLSL